MDKEKLKELLQTKVKMLEDIRRRIDSLEQARQKLLQDGLELQGAVKQISEIITSLDTPVKKEESVEVK
jgi:hypothetical protein